MTTALTQIKQSLEKATPKFAEVAPHYLRPERITRLLLASMGRNPKLAECSPESVLQFAMKCAETGLEPIGAGGAWPVPYKNKNGTVDMQFIPDYRGLVHAAREAGLIKSAKAEIVKAGDTFSYQLGLNPDLTHVPAVGAERGEIVAAYCVITDIDGDKSFVVMDIGEIDDIRNRSRAANAGPWVTDRGEMVKKTVVRRALKPYAGANVHFDAAIDADNAATGINEREPIARTVAAEDVQAGEPEYVSEPEAEEQPGDEPPAGSPEETGIVQDVTKKSGTTRGKDWTRYGVKVNGHYHNTFSDTHAEIAQSAKDNGAEVAIAYTENDKGYRDITHIEAV